MENPLVSVIVPVYNQKEYIHKCLESIINQTYNNLEIILVDDGSNDGSEKICFDYQNKNSNITLIQKINGGLSSARNIGIEAANGKYITFVDSDDYLSINFIKEAVAVLEKNKADIVIFKMLFVGEKFNKEYIERREEYDLYQILPEKTIEESLYQRKFGCCAPGKLYKKECFFNIRFPIGRVSEDLAIFHKIVDNANRIFFFDKIGYYYRQQPKSIMHKFNKKRIDALYWAIDIENYCKNLHPNIINAAKCRIFNVSLHLILDMPKEDLNEYFFIWDQVCINRLNVLFNSKARKRERIAACFSFFGKQFLRFVWNTKLAVKQKVYK